MSGLLFQLVGKSILTVLDLYKTETEPDGSPARFIAYDFFGRNGKKASFGYFKINVVRSVAEEPHKSVFPGL